MSLAKYEANRIFNMYTCIIITNSKNVLEIIYKSLELVLTDKKSL